MLRKKSKPAEPDPTLGPPLSRWQLWLGSIVALVAVFGVVALSVRLMLSDDEPDPLIMTLFTFIAVAPLFAAGRWLTRSGVGLVLAAFVPMILLIYGGWSAAGDLILQSRGLTVSATVAKEIVSENSHDVFDYHYVLEGPEEKFIPGTVTREDTTTRLTIGSTVQVREDPDGTVGPRLTETTDDTTSALVTFLFGALLTVALAVRMAVRGQRDRRRLAATGGGAFRPNQGWAP